MSRRQPDPNNVRILPHRRDHSLGSGRGYGLPQTLASDIVLTSDSHSATISEQMTSLHSRMLHCQTVLTSSRIRFCFHRGFPLPGLS